MVSLAASTRGRDESYLRTHIVPTFGARSLATIDYAACQSWVNELSTRKAPATVVKAAQIMGKVMKTAVRAKVIPHNPMAEVLLPTITESEDVYLTPARVEALADAMDSVAPRYRALVWLGCYAGPRIGELLALRWTDLDFLRRTVTVSRKVIAITGAGLVEGATKTKAGRRTVTLPRRVVGRARAASQRVSLARTCVHVARGHPGPVRQPPAPALGSCGGPGGPRRLHLPRHAAHGSKPLGCRRRLGPGGREVGRTQLGGVHQEPLRPPFPGARRGAGRPAGGIHRRVNAHSGGLRGANPQILMCTRCAPAGCDEVGLTSLHPL